ncbi:thioesterase II family protein [Umezawaea beigongshangensis]|uniref:thioesterase II family protein n=1 Tax=Umezawaea beigongshangensis TaxID=2780383 RepID=UPI0018F1FD83|nr:alpha/beta fold hydrolase [Umezawaea beigongshangensis]
MAPRNAWLRQFEPNPESPVQLVCLPHAGGAASFYVPFCRALAPVADVVAVQYPGRQERRLEPCVTDLAELADLVAEALADRLDRPTALFGHSMGATLAFELARRLPVAHVFASARRAPSRWRDEPVRVRDDAQLIAEVVALGGSSAELMADEDVVSMVLPALRGDYHAVETYRWTPEPPLTVPLTVLVGDDDPKVSPEEARAWEEHTTGEVDLRVFSGGHFYLVDHQPEVVDLVGDRLRALAAAAASTT